MSKLYVVCTARNLDSKLLLPSLQEIAKLSCTHITTPALLKEGEGPHLLPHRRIPSSSLI